MKRPDLEHIIRASTAILDVETVVVVGSQSILGKYPNAPPELTLSVEADVYIPRNEVNEGVLESSIGELSTFHETFGYYADEVSEKTSILPDGWQSRLIRIQNKNTGGGIGLCLEPHDLAIAKYIAGRPKDREYTFAMIRHELVSESLLLDRLRATNIDNEQKQGLFELIRGQFRSVQSQFRSR